MRSTRPTTRSGSAGSVPWTWTIRDLAREGAPAGRRGPHDARSPRRGRPSRRPGRAGRRAPRTGPSARSPAARAANRRRPRPPREEERRPLLPDRVGHLPRHPGRRRPRAGRVAEDVEAGRVERAQEGQRACERGVVLGREAGDDVGVDRDAGDRRPDPLDDAGVVGRGVAPAHPPQDPVVARLERQVQVRKAAPGALLRSRRRAGRRPRAAARSRRAGSAPPASRPGSGGRGPASVRAARRWAPRGPRSDRPPS